jgi:hypothetical protein
MAVCHHCIEKTSQNSNDLRPQTQKTVRANSPDGEIASVSKTFTNGLDVDKAEPGDGRFARVFSGVLAKRRNPGAESRKPTQSLDCYRCGWV